MECEQCGTVTDELFDSKVYGLLCSLCAHRQEERSEYGYGLSASTFGFLSEEE